jgi:hypothetical protein
VTARRFGLLAFAVWHAAGCGVTGKVDQGRVIQFDQDRGLVTLIRDSNYRDPRRPRYDVLPPVSVRIPSDPKDMGPAPRPGRLLNFDSGRRVLTVFDARAGQLREIPFEPASQSDASDPNSRRRIVNVASAGGRVLATVSVAEHEGQEDTWTFGDEVRYYYKQPGQALRMMNVTKTDVMHSGK